jgi:transketolase
MDVVRRGELEKVALEVRKDVVRMLGVAHASGLSRALAIVDILVYLYWEYMSVWPSERNRPDRDIFVMGKGSAAPALYACLARLGFFSRDELWSYGRLGAMLQGYPDVRTPGVDAPGGSRGGGIGLASGLALSLRMDGLGARVFCLMDDEEMCSGAAWESISSVGSDRLGNVVLIVDSNTEDGGTSRRLEAFGWDAVSADGNDFCSIECALVGMDRESPRPKALVVRTAGNGEESSPMSRDDMDNVLSLLEKETRNMELRQ